MFQWGMTVEPAQGLGYELDDWTPVAGTHQVWNVSIIQSGHSSPRPTQGPWVLQGFKVTGAWNYRQIVASPTRIHKNNFNI